MRVPFVNKRYMKGVPFLRKICKQLDFGVETPYILKTLSSTTRGECTLNVTLCHSSRVPH